MTDVWVAWTGGKPKADFTELETTDPETISPNQYRSTFISGGAKSRSYRVKGLETKFGRNSDLQTFEKKVMKHFVQYGLDTITYVSHPSIKATVVFVLTHHGLYTLKDGETRSTLLVENHYDVYDKANDSDAKEFLLNSVSDDLEKQLYENCNDNNSFIMYWLNLVHIVKTVSIDRFDQVETALRHARCQTTLERTLNQSLRTFSATGVN